MKIAYCNTIDFSHIFQQRPHHIMNILASRGHQVFWVNPEEDKTKYKEKINPNLTVYHSFDNFCNDHKDNIDVLLMSWSHRWKDIDRINPKIKLYDSLDLFPDNESEEKNMVDKVDLILATTKNIMEYQSKHTGKPIYLCENGCFNNYRNNLLSMPDDMKKIPGYKILFSGALAIDPDVGWVDYELIKQISKKHSLIIVGGIWGNQSKQSDELMNNKNVYFVGTKDYKTLQQYYANADVNIIPFRRCQTSDYSFPLKLIEASNQGTISVSTDIPIAVEINKQFPNSTLISKNHNQFMQNIGKAIKIKNDKETKQDCYSLANLHDWNSKVTIIENAINTFAQQRGIQL